MVGLRFAGPTLFFLGQYEKLIGPGPNAQSLGSAQVRSL
jgi:hypothetical protein